MARLEDVRAALGRVRFPGFPHDIVRYGIVRNVSVDEGTAEVSLYPNTEVAERADALRRDVESALRRLDGIESVRIEIEKTREEAGRAAGPEALPGVRAIVAVSSAKGGVGKSTVAVNLAASLAATGLEVGLLDADVYGPSIPIMTGARGKPYAVGERVLPVERHGLRLMSMGFFLDDRSPVIWRGPMVMSLIGQFLRDVDWGELDCLVVDMPPGTGDAALTLTQQVPIAGAVIVTTPQAVARVDVERGISMFRQVSVPIWGIVENMAWWECPDCGERDPLFGEGGADAVAAESGVPVLARIPIIEAIREGGDSGTPIRLADPGHAVSRAFDDLARELREQMTSGAGRAPT